ncbi:MAG TPA: heparan-alpha-glucosaminide N-acetyltransferase domain-containing protein [Pedococcus sp.]
MLPRVVHGGGRLVGVDVARAVALLGMMATHILRPVDATGELAWPQALAGGRASALFAVLAGVSMALVTGGPDPHRGERRLADAGGLLTRAVVIGVLGLWLGALDTPVAVILTYYALLFVLGLPFLGLRAPALLALGAAWLLLAPVVSHAVRAATTPSGPTVPTLEAASSLPAVLADLLLTGYYPAFPWLAYLLVGLGLGRLHLGRPGTAALVAACGAAAAGLAWVVSLALTSVPAVQESLVATSDTASTWDQLRHTLGLGLHGTTPTGSWWWLAVVAPHSGTPADLLHTTGTAAAVLGVSLLAARLRPRVWAVAFGAGAMTLTLYTLHVVMLQPAFWPGPGAEVWLRHASLALAIGAVVAAAGRRGPLEAVVRRASDGTAGLVLGASGGARQAGGTDRGLSG